jgi:FAD/FMN-containing dehydrogenase
MREMTYVDLQRMDDSNRQEHGVRRYWKGHYLREFSDAAIRAFLTGGMIGQVADEEAAMMPSISLQCYGGAIADVADDETAFSHRDALAECVISTRWTNPAEDTRHIALARRYAEALSLFASGGYIHAMADEGQVGTLRAYNREKLERLTALKDQYDPENVFHLNQNIQPSSHNRA